MYLILNALMLNILSVTELFDTVDIMHKSYRPRLSKIDAGVFHYASLLYLSLNH